MAWCKKSLRLMTTVLLMEMFTTSEMVTEESVFAPTTTEWPREPDCMAGESNSEVCACDALCARYRDCCRSSQHYKPEGQDLAGFPFTCSHEFGYSLYEVQNCPSTWQDTDIRERCEKPDFTYRVPLLDAPVTSKSTNITYRNWYCAACHRDVKTDSSVVWNAEFYCFDAPDTTMSDESLAELIAFDEDTKEWNLQVDGARAECSLQFLPSQEVYSLLRHCKLGIVTQCSETWMDVGVRNMCESYTARVCHGEVTYRNRHCLICNGFTSPEECHTVETTTQPLPPFSVLLDWKRLKRSTCARSELYDPIYRVCRKVYV